MAERRWIEREFEFGLTPEALPRVIERVRELPGRLEALVRGLPSATLTRRLEEAWSIQQNVGHLLDLEPLGDERLSQLLAGAEVLIAADMSNRRTEEALHNEGSMARLLAQFRRERMALVARLRALSPEDAARSALHPRLEQPMTVTDLFFFIAEHDDHHLETVRRLANQFEEPEEPE